jgi:hypothetical protein
MSGSANRHEVESARLPPKVACKLLQDGRDVTAIVGIAFSRLLLQADSPTMMP